VKPCRSRAPGCDGACTRPRTECCCGTVTAVHPLATLCLGCHSGQSPTARKQRERDAHRPTVGRRQRPRTLLFMEPVRPEREPARRSGTTPEGIVKRDSEAALRAAGLWLTRGQHGLGVKFHNNSRGVALTPGGGRITYGVGPNGTSDWVGWLCPSGLWCSLEMKAPGEEPTDAQWKHIHEVRLDGGWADWSDSAERTVTLVRAALVWASERRR